MCRAGQFAGGNQSALFASSGLIAPRTAPAGTADAATLTESWPASKLATSAALIRASSV